LLYRDREAERKEESGGEVLHGNAVRSFRARERNKGGKNTFCLNVLLLLQRERRRRIRVQKLCSLQVSVLLAAVSALVSPKLTISRRKSEETSTPSCSLRILLFCSDSTKLGSKDEPNCIRLASNRVSALQRFQGRIDLLWWLFLHVHLIVVNALHFPLLLLLFFSFATQ